MPGKSKQSMCHCSFVSSRPSLCTGASPERPAQHACASGNYREAANQASPGVHEPRRERASVEQPAKQRRRAKQRRFYLERSKGTPLLGCSCPASAPACLARAAAGPVVGVTPVRQRQDAWGRRKTGGGEGGVARQRYKGVSGSRGLGSGDGQGCPRLSAPTRRVEPSGSAPLACCPVQKKCKTGSMQCRSNWVHLQILSERVALVPQVVQELARHAQQC